jgi:hypothetical protein
VLSCGRRYGKTALAKYVLERGALTTGLQYAYFSPTYKNLAEVWRALKYGLDIHTAQRNEQEKRIELKNGGVIDCWSLSTGGLVARGRKYAGMVIDEAAVIPNLETIWTEDLRPMLTDYEGWAYFKSTPRGRNYFYQLFQMGLDPHNPYWESWSYPTLANPYIKPSEIEAARQELPEMVFRQEYLAEFLEGEGAVFRRIRDCATAIRHSEPYAGRFVAGLDLAQQNDFSVITVFDRQTRQMVDMDRFNQIGWSLQRGRIRAMYDKWQIETLVCELNSIGSPNFEALQEEGLNVVGFTTTATTKPPLIESLVLAFERAEIGIFNEPVIVGEFEAYERQVSKTTGRSQYSAPDGLHDDIVMSVALAWHGLQTPDWIFYNGDDFVKSV